MTGTDEYQLNPWDIGEIRGLLGFFHRMQMRRGTANEELEVFPDLLAHLPPVLFRMSFR